MADHKDALQRLELLLAERFDRPELMSFIRYLPDGGRLILEVDSWSMSPIQVASSLVALLKRRGQLDREFFSRLAQHRPNLGDPVNELKQAYLEFDRPTRQLARGLDLQGGRFTLEEPLGHGGFGALWRAHDNELRRRVAVKVLSHHTSEEDYAWRRIMLARGAARMAAIVHERIASVLLPHVTDQGHDFCVLEYIEGRDLYTERTRGKLEFLADIAGVLADIGCALAAIHTAGVTHNDVSPKNIVVGYLDDQVRAWLIDFDLVCGTDEALVTRLATGMPATDPYAAPEWKALGRRPVMAAEDKLDARVDVFGLGMTAVFAVLGEVPPFSLNDPRIKSDYLARIDCPPAVRAVLEKACAHDRDHRYASTTAFCEAFSRAIEALPDEASLTPEIDDPPELEPLVGTGDLEARLLANAAFARLFGEERAIHIGRYEIVGRIGGGGMADVYLGRDTRLLRTVAIKLLRPRLSADSEAKRRLLREAQALALLNHENIVRVYDVGVEENSVYIAMEYVEGQTLRGWQSGRPWQQVLDIYTKVGRGLHAMHLALVVHGDVKPSNILVGSDGRVRVADFGLASIIEQTSAERSVDEFAAESHPTESAGTPEYAAPEQLMGHRRDARSDQFSYCVALYEALYGGRPVMRLVAEGLREPPASAVPRRIHKALARGLAYDPDDRHATMADLLAALESGQGWFGRLWRRGVDS